MNVEKMSAVDEKVVAETSSVGKTAIKAVKKGTFAAKQAAENVAVAPVKLMNRAVYGVCYGLSYGVVYSALVIGKAFPADGVVSKALHEGSETAIKNFDAAHVEKVINPDVMPASA